MLLLIVNWLKCTTSLTCRSASIPLELLVGDSVAVPQLIAIENNNINNNEAKDNTIINL